MIRNCSFTTFAFEKWVRTAVKLSVPPRRSHVGPEHLVGPRAPSIFTPVFSINPTWKDSFSLKGVKLLRPVDNLVMKRFPPDSISVCFLFTPVTTANSCLMRCVTQPQSLNSKEASTQMLLEYKTEHMQASARTETLARTTQPAWGE